MNCETKWLCELILWFALFFCRFFTNFCVFFGIFVSFQTKHKTKPSKQQFVVCFQSTIQRKDIILRKKDFVVKCFLRKKNKKKTLKNNCIYYYSHFICFTRSWFYLQVTNILRNCGHNKRFLVIPNPYTIWFSVFNICWHSNSAMYSPFFVRHMHIFLSQSASCLSFPVVM